MENLLATIFLVGSHNYNSSWELRRVDSKLMQQIEIYRPDRLYSIKAWYYSEVYKLLTLKRQFIRIHWGRITDSANRRWSKGKWWEAIHDADVSSPSYFYVICECLTARVLGLYHQQSSIWMSPFSNIFLIYIY